MKKIEAEFLEEMKANKDTKSLERAVHLFEKHSSIVESDCNSDIVDSFNLDNFETFTMFDKEGSEYIAKDGREYDLRDYVNVTGFDIEFDVVDDVYLVNMFDVEKVLG